MRVQQRDTTTVMNQVFAEGDRRESAWFYLQFSKLQQHRLNCDRHKEDETLEETYAHIPDRCLAVGP